MDVGRLVPGGSHFRTALIGNLRSLQRELVGKQGVARPNVRPALIDASVVRNRTIKARFPPDAAEFTLAEFHLQPCCCLPRRNQRELPDSIRDRDSRVGKRDKRSALPSFWKNCLDLGHEGPSLRERPAKTPGDEQGASRSNLGPPGSRRPGSEARNRPRSGSPTGRTGRR